MTDSRNDDESATRHCLLRFDLASRFHACRCSAAGCIECSGNRTAIIDNCRIMREIRIGRDYLRYLSSRFARQDIHLAPSYSHSPDAERKIF